LASPSAPDQRLWATDSGANTLFKIDPATGKSDLIAVFSGLPSPFPNPNRNGQMSTDPVPTGVAVDKDGNAFVGFLSGFPFIPGSAGIVKVAPDGKVSRYATNLSMITDVVFGPDGQLYALTFAELGDGQLNFGKGKILRVREGSESEVVVDGLHSPTALSFDRDGDAYVAIKSATAPGQGEVVVYKGLTRQPALGVVAPHSYNKSSDVAWVAGSSAATAAIVPPPSTPAVDWSAVGLPLFALVCAAGASVFFSIVWKRSARARAG